MSNAKKRGVKLKPRKTETESDGEGFIADPAFPPRFNDIYESVVHDLGFDPLKEMAARRT